jgi:uncharacterized OsmC-like protein
MKIASRVRNREGTCKAQLSTNGQVHEIGIVPKDDGKGSRANGGELLCLALATCFCNDIYREASSRDIEVIAVEVEVEAQFGGVGEPAQTIGYSASVAGRASETELRNLIELTDGVTEIQNTLRQGMPVKLLSFHVESVT